MRPPAQRLGRFFSQAVEDAPAVRTISEKRRCSSVVSKNSHARSFVFHLHAGGSDTGGTGERPQSKRLPTDLSTNFARIVPPRHSGARVRRPAADRTPANTRPAVLTAAGSGEKGWAIQVRPENEKGPSRSRDDPFPVGSAGRTRTYDRAVNSRLLYQLSYRGSERRLRRAMLITDIAAPCEPFRQSRREKPRTRWLGGADRNRTDVQGFAGLCITTLPPRRRTSRQRYIGGGG